MHISIKIEQVGNIGNYFDVTCGNKTLKMVSVNEKWLQDIIYQVRSKTSGFKGEMLPPKDYKQWQEKSSSTVQPTPTESANNTSPSETRVDVKS